MTRTLFENYLYESLGFFSVQFLLHFFFSTDTYFLALILVSISKTCYFAVFVCLNDIKSLILN